MRLNETVESRDQANYISTLVHTEWLDSVICGYEEDYKGWAQFAAQLVLEVSVPRQRDGNAE